jgi:hypothetical protein
MSKKSYKKSLTIYHTVSAAQDTANKVIIDIKSGAAYTSDFIFMADHRDRTGIQKTGCKYTYARSGGLLTIIDNSTSYVTSGDLLVIRGVFE